MRVAPRSSWHVEGALPPPPRGQCSLCPSSWGALPRMPPAAPVPWRPRCQPACCLIGHVEPGQMAAGPWRHGRRELHILGLAGPCLVGTPAFDWEIPGAWICSLRFLGLG